MALAAREAGVSPELRLSTAVGIVAALATEAGAHDVMERRERRIVVHDLQVLSRLLQVERAAVEPQPAVSVPHEDRLVGHALDRLAYRGGQGAVTAPKWAGPTAGVLSPFPQAAISTVQLTAGEILDLGDAHWLCRHREDAQARAAD